MGTNVKDKRVQYLDIAKGIVMVLVVWQHSKGPFSECITAFHMPFFFLVSGLLYNGEIPFWKFLGKKFRSLYVPFVFWNIVVYVVAHMNGFRLNSFWKFTKKVLLTLDKEPDYLGATWFLGALFAEIILYKLLDSLLKKVKYRRILVTLVFVLRAAYAFEHTLPHKMSRTLILGLFFALGVLIKEHKEQLMKYQSRWWLPIFVLPYLLIAFETEHGMGDNHYTSAIIFVVGALMGAYIILEISKLIEKSNNKVMDVINRISCFIGKNSIDILIWHFVFFRVAIAIQLLLVNKPLNTVFDYDKRYDTSGAWWLLYLIVGIGCSLIWGRILHLIYQKGIRKIICQVRNDESTQREG